MAITDKRQRLIEAAKTLIYKQGFKLTTLSDIAIESGVPLGNVYYYFKTKDEIAVAVLELIAQQQKTFFQNLNQEPSAKARLLYFLEHLKEESTLIANQGCRIGTLCQELSKDGGILANLSAKVVLNFMLWMEAQFYDLGFIQEASNLSVELLYKLQGLFLLGFAFKDAKLINRQITLMQEDIKARITENEEMAIPA